MDRLTEGAVCVGLDFEKLGNVPKLTKDVGSIPLNVIVSEADSSAYKPDPALVAVTLQVPIPVAVSVDPLKVHGPLATAYEKDPVPLPSVALGSVAVVPINDVPLRSNDTLD